MILSKLKKCLHGWLRMFTWPERERSLVQLYNIGPIEVSFKEFSGRECTAFVSLSVPYFIKGTVSIGETVKPDFEMIPESVREFVTKQIDSLGGVLGMRNDLAWELYQALRQHYRETSVYIEEVWVVDISLSKELEQEREKRAQDRISAKLDRIKAKTELIRSKGRLLLAEAKFQASRLIFLAKFQVLSQLILQAE